jgi:hypothetical protein
VIQLAASVLARLSELLALLEPRPNTIAIPIHRSDWRRPRGGGGRH